MTWLLRLYPRAWRQRYAGEVAEMLAGRAFSLRIAIDLIAGAIDTWLHPSATLAAAAEAAPRTREEQTMLTKLLRFDCGEFYGPGVTREDQWKATVSVIVITLALTAVWMLVHIRVGDNAMVDALSLLPFMFASFYSMRFTFLKGRAASVQAVFVATMTAFVAVILLAAGWVSARI